MFEKNLLAEKETTLNVNGRNVKFIEYETAPEGDFVKVCTNHHDLGIAAEYVWFQNKYNNAIRTKQEFNKIKLNGNVVDVDILTIKINNDTIKNIYFDISQMMENLNNIALDKTNKDLWEEKAKIIYEKLINEFNFSVYNDDEECLYKEINKNISIGFDINYYFGFILKNNELDEMLRMGYAMLLRKYVKNDFIGKIINENNIIGGYIKIDCLNDISVVFENYKNLEEECLKWETELLM
jgi:uncharacterized protein YifE (UPF0438 family)